VSRRAVTRGGAGTSVGRMAGLLVSVAVLSGCAAAPDCERIAGVRPGACPVPVADRQPVPDMALPVIASEVAAATDSLAGVKELSLADLKGRVVVVNFWASWCGPCRVEQPDINAAWELVPADEVAVIGVNIEDTRANALAHLEEFGVPYASLFDPANELAGRFSGIGARTIPTTLFLDADGQVAARLLGLTDTREIAALAAAVARE